MSEPDQQQRHVPTPGSITTLAMFADLEKRIKGGHQLSGGAAFGTPSAQALRLLRADVRRDMARGRVNSDIAKFLD